MKIDHFFIGFMAAVGLAAGVVLIAIPQAHDWGVSPYFWILIAMALFEVVLLIFWRGAPGRMISNGARLLGFVVAAVIMVMLPILAGSPAKLF